MEGVNIEAILRATMKRVGSIEVTGASGKGPLLGFRVRDASFLFGEAGGNRWSFTREPVDFPEMEPKECDITLGDDGVFNIGDVLRVGKHKCEWAQTTEERALEAMGVATEAEVWDRLRLVTEEVFGLSPTGAQFKEFIPRDVLDVLLANDEITKNEVTVISSLLASWLGVEVPTLVKTPPSYWDELEVAAKKKGLHFKYTLPRSAKKEEPETNIYEEAVDVIADALGIKTSALFLTQVLSPIKGDMVKWGVQDTEIRSKVANTFSRYIGAGDVPTYGTPKEQEEAYWSKLNECARSHHLKLIKPNKKFDKVATACQRAETFLKQVTDFQPPAGVTERLLSTRDDLVDNINWYLVKGPEAVRVQTQVAVMQLYLRDLGLDFSDSDVEKVITIDHDLLTAEVSQVLVEFEKAAEQTGYSYEG